MPRPPGAHFARALKKELPPEEKLVLASWKTSQETVAECLGQWQLWTECLSGFSEILGQVALSQGKPASGFLAHEKVLHVFTSPPAQKVPEMEPETHNHTLFMNVWSSGRRCMMEIIASEVTMRLQEWSLGDTFTKAFENADEGCIDDIFKDASAELGELDYSNCETYKFLSETATAVFLHAGVFKDVSYDADGGSAAALPGSIRVGADFTEKARGLLKHLVYMLFVPRISELKAPQNTEHRTFLGCCRRPGSR